MDGKLFPSTALCDPGATATAALHNFSPAVVTLEMDFEEPDVNITATELWFYRQAAFKCQLPNLVPVTLDTSSDLSVPNLFAVPRALTTHIPKSPRSEGAGDNYTTAP